MKNPCRFICNRYTAAYLVAIFAEFVVYVTVQYGVFLWASEHGSNPLVIWTIIFLPLCAALIAAVIGFFASAAILQSHIHASGRAFLVATAAGLVAYFLLEKAFLKAFIKYWEWQHGGRPMKFTFWADDRAVPSALLFVPVAFLFVFWLMRDQES